MSNYLYYNIHIRVHYKAINQKRHYLIAKHYFKILFYHIQLHISSV